MVQGIAGAAGTWVLVTFGLYLLVLIGIGVWSSQFMETVSDYVIGGREIGPVVTGFSERASEMSGWLTLAVPANVFGVGIFGLYNAIGMIPADLFSWAALAKRLRKYTEIVRSVTLPTFFETRLADNTGVVKGVSSVILLIFEGGYVGAQIVAAGTLLEVLTGVDLWIGIVVGGVIVVGYTMLGGYFAVAWSDFFQGGIIIFAFLALPALAFGAYGSPFAELTRMDASLTSITGGATGWAALFGIISYAAIGLGMPGNPHVMVRFMGIDRVRNIRYAAVVAQLFMFVAYIGAGLVGLYALVAFGQGGVTDPDNVMPLLALKLLPDVLAGIVLAAALAAIMSSADSQLLVATSAVVEDVYHGFLNREASEAQLVRYSRYVTLGLGIASVSFAYLARGTPIYTLVLDYAWGGLGAALGPTIIASLWWKRLTAAGSVASMVVGSITMILWTQLSAILGMVGMMPAAETSPFLNGLVTVYGLFPAFVLSTVVLITVSLLTDPPERVGEEFDVFDKPLSEVTTGTDDRDTSTYVTDGGTISGNESSDTVRSRTVATEVDVIRAYTEITGYCDTGENEDRTNETETER